MRHATKQLKTNEYSTILIERHEWILILEHDVLGGAVQLHRNLIILKWEEVQEIQDHG
jgi:hypothetical protein